MPNRLAVLTGLALGGCAFVTAADVPFSHRTHLKLKLNCVNCHVAVVNSTRAEDNNLPDKAVCLRCHKEAKIKTPRSTLVAKFNHQFHLKFGNIAPVIARSIDNKTYLSRPGDIRRWLNTKNACEACHRGLEESDQVTKAAFPQMADCLVCHTKIEPPFSCPTCHAENARLKPADHTPTFVDAHSSGKLNLDKQTCPVCHARKFTCMGCHSP